MKSVKEPAYAKLNLCLNVGKRTESGYHLLESVMQSVSLCDTVTVAAADRTALRCDAPGLPTDGGNLALRAAAEFFAESGVVGGADITLEKRVPVGAGLGGGSADAAAVLRALNALYGRPLDAGTLLRLAARIGADVPFCVFGGTAFAEGFGEKLKRLPDLKLYYVLVTDETPLSTPEMYRKLDGRRPSPVRAAECALAAERGDAAGAAALAGNSFTALAAEKCPLVRVNIEKLLKNGAVGASVTGKGPTAFGAFTSKSAALKCSAALKGSVFCESVGRRE